MLEATDACPDLFCSACSRSLPSGVSCGGKDVPARPASGEVDPQAACRESCAAERFLKEFRTPPERRSSSMHAALKEAFQPQLRRPVLRRGKFLHIRREKAAPEKGRSGPDETKFLMDGRGSFGFCRRAVRFFLMEKAGQRGECGVRNGNMTLRRAEICCGRACFKDRTAFSDGRKFKNFSKGFSPGRSPGTDCSKKNTFFLPVQEPLLIDKNITYCFYLIKNNQIHVGTKIALSLVHSFEIPHQHLLPVGFPLRRAFFVPSDLSTGRNAGKLRANLWEDIL